MYNLTMPWDSESPKKPSVVIGGDWVIFITSQLICRRTLPAPQVHLATEESPAVLVQ